MNRSEVDHSPGIVTGDFLDTRNLRSRNPLVNATLSLVLLSGSAACMPGGYDSRSVSTPTPSPAGDSSSDCPPATVDELISRGAVEGQPGFVHQDTGFIDENTGEEHPMLVDGYSVRVVEQPTGITMQDGTEYRIKRYEYVPNNCAPGESK